MYDIIVSDENYPWETAKNTKKQGEQKMKKLLCLLLALLMIASVALISCDEEEPIEDDEPLYNEDDDLAFNPTLTTSEETTEATNILFICGGAFDGLEKIIEARIGKKSIGFNAEIADREKRNVGELFKQVLPQDFVKFGLIPEFIGRVPITVGLDLLDEQALVRILTEPKNAIVKQYKRLFEFDGVELEFTEGAIREIARRSIERKTGARGLRAIMETIMMDVMYRIPSEQGVVKCIITEEAAKGEGEPEVLYTMGVRKSLG